MKMNRVGLFSISVVVVAALHADARACKPLGQVEHMIVAAMQETDRTPPTLPIIPPPEIHYGDGASSGCGSDCPDRGFIQIPAVATDDMTPPEKIGYRFTLAAGDLVPGLTLPATAVDPNIGDAVSLYWNGTTGRPVDFTLQVVAIDLAGNESAPQSLHIVEDTSHNCAVARGRASHSPLAWVMLMCWAR